jgi:hypothetical protein
MGKDMSSVTLLEIDDEGTDSLKIDVAKIADTVCVTAERAVLDGIDATLAVVAEKSAESADKLHEISAKIVSRAQVMQTEIGRYLAVLRGRTV